MNYAPREFSHGPPNDERTKTVFSCRACNHAAGIDAWPEQARDGRTVRFDYPDCGAIA